MNTSPAGEWFWKDAEGKSGLPGFMSQGTESPKVLALGAVTGTVLGYLFLGLLVYFLFRVFSQY
jgi:hypothetical protein